MRTQKHSFARTLLVFIAGAASVVNSPAQDYQRRAAITRGGGPGGAEGCIVDVVVDGAAEIEIRGDNALVRNLFGAAPQLRQFNCTRPVPPYAPGFRFNAVDGRGRQELVRTPREGSPAVIRIDDPQGGAGEYRFEISWGADPGVYRREPGDRGYDPNRDPDRDHNGYQNQREQYFRQGDAWRQRFFERVRQDVEHLQGSTFPFSGEQSRLSRTVFELNDLQSKMAQGRYDDHELNDVMDSLASIIQYNRLSAGDREILSNDLSRM
ncbi:MAG: hypothetical protein M3N93_07010, partial [Acidobacteriota bacterium]|nr:hypothetical protein [Acidobacteriota bacterium]